MKNDHGKYLYVSLYEKLREEIIGGVYCYDDKLPSKRVLAEENGISVISVVHALELLEDEGYVEGAERRGYFVKYRKNDSFFGAGPQKRAIPPAPAAMPDTLFPFSVLSHTMRRVLSVYAENIYVRCPSGGVTELREALSRFLVRNKGISVSPDRILVGAGAEWLYMLFAQIFGKDSTFAIEDPSYEKIDRIYGANGVRTVKLKLGEDGICSEELTNCRANVLHVTPYRSVPTGISTSGAKRREYLDWAMKNGGYILEDDYTSEFSLSKKPGETIFSIGHDNVIYVNSFAQTVCPTIRVGYAVLPKQLMERYENTVGFYTCPVPVFEQYVLAELIENGDFERHLNRVRRKRRKEERS